MRILTVILAVAVMSMIVAGCGGKSKQVRQDTSALEGAEHEGEALSEERAVVKSAKHIGADRSGPRMPIIEIQGTMPGSGYEARVKEERTGNRIDLRVMAVPGPDAVKGEQEEYTTRYTVRDLDAGATWSVRVKDHRNVDVEILEFKY